MATAENTPCIDASCNRLHSYLVTNLKTFSIDVVLRQQSPPKEIAQHTLRVKATLDTQADVLTKFMGGRILARQRGLVGCVPLGNAS